MREGPVGFRHLVGVLALLDGVSPVIGCVEQLGREPFGHRLFVALARGRDDPANAERLPARRAHFHRHLISGAADAPRAHFDRRITLSSACWNTVSGASLVLLSIISSAP